MSVTPRQVRILELVARGKGDKEIALELGKSYHTVKTQLENMRYKLRAGNRAHLVMVGLSLGLIDPLPQEELESGHLVCRHCGSPLGRSD